MEKKNDYAFSSVILNDFKPLFDYYKFIGEHWNNTGVISQNCRITEWVKLKVSMEKLYRWNFCLDFITEL